MDFALSPEDEQFRDELRAFLTEHLPEFQEGEEIVDPWLPRNLARRRAWQRRMHEHGWAAINWPKEWGGREATIMQNFIYSQETAKAKAPGILNAVGIWHIGPMILRQGTKEQQDRWLPGILTAEDVWCQGFSEPEAGSDLANLRTTAIREGDSYVVNGQKIWITTAHLADWGMFLFRTDPTAIERGAKHEGITAFIIDMHSPGIEIRPIKDITGEEAFTEVFFNDVRIPAENRIGEDGEGWLVAMGTLSHERVGTAGLSITMAIELEDIIKTVRKLNPEALEDPTLRDRIARAFTQVELTRLLNARALSKIMKGEKNWPEVPLAKLQWSYLAQTLAELNVDLLGPLGLLWKGEQDAVDSGAWSRLYVYQRYTSIGAGTTEIQKNVIADRALKIPSKKPKKP
jgi:alkylation response protein AidB-like acyl-CoA dehydrogenase